MLIDNDGIKHASIKFDDALKRAKEAQLDLVLVSPAGSNPVVCKLMDYGKHMFAKKKNNSSSKEFLKVLSDYGYHFFRNIGFRNANNDLYLSCYMHNIHDFPLSNIFDVLCICKNNIIYDYLFKSSVKINKNK